MDQPDDQMREPRTEAGEIGFSDAFLTHGLTPANLGILPKPDAYGQTPRQGGCDDVIELYAYVRDGVITELRYMTSGCLHTVACGSALTTLLQGRSIDAVIGLSPDDIAAELGGLDPAHFHCAELAAATWRAALADYRAKQRSPWTKLYQRR
jgi:NifU-like protein involved in Fe-S cluster formation